MRNLSWVLDLETLDTESTSVILSAALVYFEVKLPFTVAELKQQSICVKFDVADQRTNYKRTVSKDTLTWWSKQSRESQIKSLLPSSADLSAEDGLDALADFFHSHGATKNSYIYSRGSFDNIILESLNRAVGNKPLVHFANYRDTRTFISVMYPAAVNNYVEVDKTLCTDYDEAAFVHHDPVSDVIKDICMMLGGKQ